MNVRDLIEYKTRAADEEERKTWLLRFELANLLGLTDEKIETSAKKRYEANVKDWTGKGFLGNETWEDRCENWRKFLSN